MLSEIKWAHRPNDPSIENGLIGQGLEPWLARLYASRGVRSISEAIPTLGGLLHFNALLNIDAAARRLAQAIEAGQRIVVVGDYDADGATATATAVLGLRMLGADRPQFVVPDRFKHGYGLSPEVVRLAAQHKPHLIVTVDNGIAAFAGIEEARRLGIDVLVTDHHLAGDRLPDTPLIVNPNQGGCGFSGKNTAGVGVMFYVLLATRAQMMSAGKFSQEDKPRLEDLLDLVALGTVADVVRLDSNNRRFVAAGLKRIRSGSARPLIKALFKLAKREARYAASMDLGFYIGPRINAAGRMDDMSLGIHGLLMDDEGRAQEIAEALDGINRERKERQKQMEREADVMIDEAGISAQQASLVLYQPEWHEGVIGLVASRVKEKHWRPTIVFCDDRDGHLKGSGRSIAGLHLRDAIDLVDRRLPGAILKFGGHAMAAGLSIDKAALPRFQSVFEEVCRSTLSDEALQRIAILDTAPEWGEVSFEMAAKLESLVWGQGFEPPTFGSSLPIVRQDVIKDAHLKFEVDAGHGRRIKGICFGRTEPISEESMVAWKLEPERWNGREAPSIRVEQVFEQIRRASPDYNAARRLVAGQAAR